MRNLRVGLLRMIGAIHGFEWVALINVAASYAYLRSSGVAVGWITLGGDLWLTVPFYASCIAFGLGLRTGAEWLRHRREEITRLLRPSSVLLLVRIVICATLVHNAYSWLKLSVPLVRDVSYDPLLWRLDRAIHFGADPVLSVPEILSWYGALGAIDTYYAFFFPSIILAFAWFGNAPDTVTRCRFALGYGLLWSVGGWLYVAIPALGPCYVAQRFLLPFYPELPISSEMQQALWRNYQRVLEARVSGVIRAPFNPGYGIACMPSLHVGAHAFLSAWAWRRERALFWIFLLATELTLVGSVATGWHYAVDGYAGILLALACATVVRVGWRGRDAGGGE